MYLNLIPQFSCFLTFSGLVGKGKPTVVNCIKCPLSYHLDCVVDRSIFEGNDDGLKVYMEQFECDPCLWAWHPLPGQAVWCEKPGHGYSLVLVLGVLKLSVTEVNATCTCFTAFGRPEFSSLRKWLLEVKTKQLWRNFQWYFLERSGVIMTKHVTRVWSHSTSHRMTYLRSLLV